jgi:Ca-activated chloride channel family protein
MTPAVDARPLRRKTIALLGASAAIAAAAALLTARDRPLETTTDAPVGRCGEATRTENGGMILEVRGETCNLVRGVSTTHVAIEVTAPAEQAAAREPVEMALVIDRSGSMGQGRQPAIEDARAAALRAIDALDESDAFSLVLYSTSAEVRLPMGRATAAHKAAAREEIAMMRAVGGTNISAGLELGARSVAGICADCRHREHIDRIVLISDGDPTEGTQTLEGLGRVASRIAAGGASITSVGVGLDFDEQIMTSIAVAGRGNYYFVERPSDLVGMFDRELASLGKTVAVDASLELTPGAGVTIADAYGYRVDRAGSAVTVPIADLTAGERRKVILRLEVDGKGDVMELVKAKLRWRGIGEHQLRVAERGLAVTLTDDASQLIVDPAAAEPIAQARLAVELEEANRAYEQGDYRRADDLVEQATDRAVMSAPAMKEKAAEVKQRVKGNYDRGKAGGKSAPLKDNRNLGYELTR